MNTVKELKEHVDGVEKALGEKVEELKAALDDVSGKLAEALKAGASQGDAKEFIERVGKIERQLGMK